MFTLFNHNYKEETISKSSRKNHGFTIIEMLIALLITAIILAVVYDTFVSQRNVLRTQELITEMHQNVRATISMILSEIKLAGLSPLEVEFDGIIYSPDQLQIRIDMTGNGDTLDSNEDITYKFDPNTLEILRRTGGGGFQTFAENIQNFAFEYYDANYNKTTQSDNISTIKITIVGRTSSPDPDFPQNNGYRIFPLTTSVTPRNLSVIQRE